MFLKIILPILISIIIISLLVTFALTLFWNNQNQRGYLVFKVNYHKMRIKMIKHKSILYSKLPDTQWISRIYSGKWIKLEKFLNIFNNHTIKTIRNNLFEINKGNFNNIESKLFSRSDKEFKKYTITSWFTKLSNNLIQINIKFNFIDTQTKSKQYFKPINKLDIIEKISEKSMIILGLKLKKGLKFPFNYIKEIKKINLFQEIHYSIINDEVLIIFPTNKPAKLKEKILKKYNKFNNKLKSLGLSQFFVASGLHHFNTPTILREINNIFMVLKFLLNKSINTKKLALIFEDDNDYFRDFKKSYIKLDQIIIAQAVETEKTKIKQFEKSEALMDYIYPTYTKIKNKRLVILLKDPSIRERMINSHAEVHISKSRTTHALMDVNSDWFISRSNNIKNNKIIYCLNLTKKTSLYLLIKIIKKLYESNIYCAIRIKKINNKTITFINRIKPMFLVIDKVIAGNAHKKDIFAILCKIKQIAKYNNSKIIFELPSLYLDKRQIKKIGLNFYYNFK